MWVGLHRHGRIAYEPVSKIAECDPKFKNKLTCFKYKCLPSKTQTCVKKASKRCPKVVVYIGAPVCFFDTKNASKALQKWTQGANLTPKVMPKCKSDSKSFKPEPKRLLRFEIRWPLQNVERVRVPACNPPIRQSPVHPSTYLPIQLSTYQQSTDPAAANYTKYGLRHQFFRRPFPLTHLNPRTGSTLALKIDSKIEPAPKMNQKYARVTNFGLRVPPICPWSIYLELHWGAQTSKKHAKT